MVYLETDSYKHSRVMLKGYNTSTNLVFDPIQNECDMICTTSMYMVAKQYVVHNMQLNNILKVQYEVKYFVQCSNQSKLLVAKN